jgi:hypothetical protein
LNRGENPLVTVVLRFVAALASRNQTMQSVAEAEISAVIVEHTH